MNVFLLAQGVGQILDITGVIVLLTGVFYSTGVVIVEFFRAAKTDKLYRTYRTMLGRSILLGLEFLIAGDIVSSITGTPNFTSIGALALLVLIRSFLAITFEMEVDGRWPWQRPL